MENKRQLTHYRVSNSKNNTFKDCGRKGWFKYINQVVSFVITSKPLEKGNGAHRVLQETMASPKEIRKKVLKNEISKYLDKIKNPELKKFIEASFGTLLPILNNLVEKFDDILSLEGYYEVEAKDFDEYSRAKKNIEYIVNRDPALSNHEINIKGIAVNGYIDAYLIYNGKRAVIDWKTGKMTLKNIRKHSKQAQLYVHILRLLGFVVELAIIVYLDQGGAMKEVDVSKDVCEKVFNDHVKDFIKVVSKDIGFNDFEPNFKHYCYSCEYNFMCAFFENEIDLLDPSFTEMIKLEVLA